MGTPVPPECSQQSDLNVEGKVQNLSARSAESPNKIARRIVIIGGGFGGLACAQQLGHSDAKVILIDRRNHNLFQPLLYQVATAALSPADIAEPIRRSLARYRNVSMVMAEAVAIDTDARKVVLGDGGTVDYDQLVVATGSEYNYFGHDEWQGYAPGLKTIHEAREIRQRLLLAFEQAEITDDPELKRSLLTFIVIGGGPTGVEMAGAISELGRFMISSDFRHLHPDDLRVILVEAGPRLLAAFPEHLARYASKYLSRIGVEVRTSTRVEGIQQGSVAFGGQTVKASCIVWGAGVKASPASRWLAVEAAAGGRIAVDENLRVKGLEDVFAIGDTALYEGTDAQPLPGLAQVAKQQGVYLGRYLRIGSPPNAPGFVFHNRGNTAVIGRHAAVFDFGRWTLKGRVAWFLWAFVHVYLLINFEKRILVTVQWIWRYLTRQRGARIIDEGFADDVSQQQRQDDLSASVTRLTQRTST
jgi:NADH dehydrogenase